MKRLFIITLILLCFVQFSACGKTSSSYTSSTYSYNDEEDEDYEEEFSEDEVEYKELDIGSLTPSELEDFMGCPEIVESWLESRDVFDYLEWEDVESSAIEEVGYADWPFEVLGIVFNNSPNRVYLYYDVPYWVYDELVNADSIGRYFKSEIEGQYEYERWRS